MGTTILKELPIDNNLELQSFVLKFDISNLLPGDYSSNFVLFQEMNLVHVKTWIG